MKFRLLFAVFLSLSLRGMDISSVTKEEGGDEIIEMDSNKDYSPRICLKKGCSPQSNDDIDIELGNMQYTQGYNDRAEYKKILLSELPIFYGESTEKISILMDEIGTFLPKKFGEITEAITHSYKLFKKRAKSNRGFTDIDPKEVININDKIQYALLQVHSQNQKIAEQNRQEDLAQAASDRFRTTVISVVSLVFSVPAITLAIFNIIKAVR